MYICNILYGDLSSNRCSRAHVQNESKSWPGGLKKSWPAKNLDLSSKNLDLSLTCPCAFIEFLDDPLYERSSRTKKKLIAYCVNLYVAFECDFYTSRNTLRPSKLWFWQLISQFMFCVSEIFISCWRWCQRRRRCQSAAATEKPWLLIILLPKHNWSKRYKKCFWRNFYEILS